MRLQIITFSVSSVKIAEQSVCFSHTPVYMLNIKKVRINEKRAILTPINEQKISWSQRNKQTNKRTHLEYGTLVEFSWYKGKSITV